MIKRVLNYAALSIGAALLAGCSKQEPRVGPPKFDPKYIAAEADKGNLQPLKDLNAACSGEIEKTGKRGSACTAQDEVGESRKPLKLNF